MLCQRRSSTIMLQATQILQGVSSKRICQTKGFMICFPAASSLTFFDVPRSKHSNNMLKVNIKDTRTMSMFLCSCWPPNQDVSRTKSLGGFMVDSAFYSSKSAIAYQLFECV